MNLKKILDDFAEALAKKASKEATTLQESTDTFKALTAYYSAQQKRRSKSEDDEPDDGGFTFAEGLGADGGKREKVHPRRSS